MLPVLFLDALCVTKEKADRWRRERNTLMKEKGDYRLHTLPFFGLLLVRFYESTHFESLLCAFAFVNKQLFEVIGLRRFKQRLHKYLGWVQLAHSLFQGGRMPKSSVFNAVKINRWENRTQYRKLENAVSTFPEMMHTRDRFSVDQKRRYCDFLAFALL